MKPATVHQIKRELNQCTKDHLVEICLRLAKYKRDNKELLSYLLFEKNETQYVEDLKNELTQQFGNVNSQNVYFGKKTIRKIRRYLNRFIRYTQNAESEVQLRIHYCKLLQDLPSFFAESKQMQNLYQAQIKMIKKALSKLHEDLQYDYNAQLGEILEWN